MESLRFSKGCKTNPAVFLRYLLFKIFVDLGLIFIRYFVRSTLSVRVVAGLLIGASILLSSSLYSADKPARNKPAGSSEPADIESALQAAKIEFTKGDEGNIVEVTFGSQDKGPISASNLKLVSKITTLKSLGSRLSSDHVSTEELGTIASIKTLETLKFDCCQFKGSDLKKLLGLPKLTTIDWTDSQIDDEGLRGIGTLKALTILRLRGNQVSDAGVKFLTKMKLAELNLDKTKDDIYIEKATPITDASLISLKGMKELRLLSLQRNAITDAGLKHLADFKSLNELNLANTQVTAAGIAKLQAALPDCKITSKE